MKKLLPTVIAIFGFPWVGYAQQTLTTGVVTGAIGCAPSNNGTGHMVCAEYTTSGAVLGVSWQAPPRPIGAEPVGSVLSVPVAALGGTPFGLPGCAPANDGQGTASCLLMSKASSGVALQGVSIYPPSNLSSPLQSLLPTNLPATTSIGNPGCANAGANAVVICALVVNNQVNAIGFRPQNSLTGQPAISSALTPLASPTLPVLTNVTGNPSCVTVSATTVTCTIRQQQTLVGFAVQFTPPQTGSVGSVAYTAALVLPTGTFSGDPSCAQAAVNTAVNCGIVSGAELLGIGFDVVGRSAPKSYLTLGTAPDGGTWNGGVGCSDFRTVGIQDRNLMGCALVSSTGNLFRVTFDAQTGTTLGPNGPFAPGINGIPSCLALAIDMDEMYCGETTTGGASVASRLPVGILGPATIATVLSIL